MVGRKRDWPLRLIFDAIFYVLKNSCGWRDVPGDFPPSGTVHYYFQTWRDNGLLEFLCQELGGDYRELVGKNRSPSVGTIDAQSTKGTAVSSQSETGYDAGKKVKGRKRHLMVDTLSLIISVWVSAADWQDRTAACWLFVKTYMNRVDSPRLQVFFADGGCTGKLVHYVKKQFRRLNWQLYIVKKDENLNTFKVLPKLFMKYIILLLLLSSSVICFTQGEHDHLWLFGYTSDGQRTMLDFSDDPMEISMVEFATDIAPTNTTMSDKNGNLLFFSNGCQITNADFEVMENGDTINPGMMQQIYCPSQAINWPQGVIALPLPESDSLYYVFNLNLEGVYPTPPYLGIAPRILYGQLIDMTENNRLGRVIEKNMVIKQDTFL